MDAMAGPVATIDVIAGMPVDMMLRRPGASKAEMLATISLQ